MRTLPDPYVLAFLLAAGLALLLLYNRLLAAVRGSLACFRGQNGTQEMLGNQYVCDSVRVSLLVLVPFYALALVAGGLSTVGYFQTLAALLLLWLFRKLFCLLLGWLSARPSLFRVVERTGYAVWVLAMLVSLLAALLGWLVPQTPRPVLLALLAVPAAAGFAVYVRRGLSFFLQAEFSPFFWVLYLCALEILPICVVVNRLIHGN